MTKRLSIFLMFASLLVTVQVWGQDQILPSVSPVYTLTGTYGEVWQVDGYTGIPVVKHFNDCDTTELCPGKTIAFGPNGDFYVMYPDGVIGLHGSGLNYNSLTEIHGFPTVPTCSPCAALPLVNMAFNPADSGLYFGAGDGIWKLPFVNGSLSGQPIHLNGASLTAFRF